LVNVPVLILVLLVNAAHQGGCWGKDLVDEDEDGLLGGELDSLANDVDELTDSQIGRDQILLLVDGRDIALLDLLANNLFVICQQIVGQQEDQERRRSATRQGHPPVCRRRVKVEV
jgi:hypothetical protein